MLLGHQKKKRKETLFYGQTDLPSRVGQSGLYSFFFLVTKMTKKNQKSPKKSDDFCRKTIEKTFSVIFKKN